MSVRIRLSDGSAFVVESDFGDMHNKVISAIQDALPLLEVRNGTGKMRSINPRQIVTIEETDNESLTSGEAKVLESVERRREIQPQ